MKFKIGQYYKCISDNVEGFTPNQVYVAISDDQLVNNDNKQCYVYNAESWFEPVDNIKCAEKVESVYHPNHYNKENIECFDVIKAFYGNDAFESFCLGNILKYVMRCKLKGKYIDDLKKARVYIDEIINIHSKES